MDREHGCQRVGVTRTQGEAVGVDGDAGQFTEQ